MRYMIVATSSRWSRQVLRTQDFATAAAAAEWFTDTMAEWFAEDTPGPYLYASFIPAEGGYYDECADEAVAELPGWWKGEGWYDERKNLVMNYATPRDGSFEDITSLQIGDVMYALEKEQYLRTIEVAQMLGLTRQTVYSMAKRGELKAERVANRWMFLKSQVDEMLPY